MRRTRSRIGSRWMMVAIAIASVAIATIIAFRPIKSAWHAFKAHSHRSMSHDYKVASMRMRANAGLRLPISSWESDGKKGWHELADEVEVLADAHIAAAKYHERKQVENSDD